MKDLGVLPSKNAREGRRWASPRRGRAGVSWSVGLPRAASKPAGSLAPRRNPGRRVPAPSLPASRRTALLRGPAPSADLPPEVLPLPPAPPLSAHVLARDTRWLSACVLLSGPRVCGSRCAPAFSAMGRPKRKAPGGQDGAAPPAGTAKRARTEELTGVRFKAQLRDPQGAGPGECGARGRECERARLPPGFGLGGASVCRHSRSFLQRPVSRFAVGKPRPGCFRVQGADLLDCDSSLRLYASLSWTASLSKL